MFYLRRFYTLCFFFLWIFSSWSPKRDCVRLFYVQYFPQHQVGLVIILKKIFHHCNPERETRVGPQDVCFSDSWGSLRSMWSISHGEPAYVTFSVSSTLFLRFLRVYFVCSQFVTPYLCVKWWLFLWNMLLSPVNSNISRLVGLLGPNLAVLSDAVVSSTLIITSLSRTWALVRNQVNIQDPVHLWHHINKTM